VRVSRLGTVLLCVALLAGAARAWAADAESVTLNFVNADIAGVVKAVSEITGKNFVLDPRVKGTVNIISSKPVSRTLVYDIFLSALRVQGYTAIEDRNIVRIVPEAEAKEYRTPVLSGPREAPRSAGDLIQTQVFTLRYQSAAQLVPVLRPLITRNNTIAAYPGANALVITDYAGNLARIGKIIESIDQPDSTDPVLIPLRHASALDIAQSLSRVFSDAGQAAVAAANPAHQLTIVPDARTNSLIVRAASPTQLFRVRGLVATLDTPTSASGSIHLVYMKNADATKVAETLRAIYLGEAAPTARAGTVPTASTATDMLKSATTLTGGRSSAPAAPSAGGGIIQADAATNSVIINAPDAVYNNLRAILEKLDARRAQVYVEALIAEVRADKAAQFGIQWQVLGGLESDSPRVFGGTNFGGTGQNIIGLTQNVASASRGLNVGVIDGKVTIPGVGQVVNLGVLARALESDANANILSTPTLLTLDNEEAVISVGENVPFITGQYALSGAATTPTPFQTIERRDVGLTLRVRPQISENGTVQLQIYQEVSSVQDKANAAGIITNKRAVASTVLVDDGQVVVIGGLIQDSVNDGIEKVPGLGDLPLLGGLFRYKTRSQTKTNLMVFLRPRVVRDSAHANAYSDDRYNYIIGEQKRLQPAHDAVLPDVVAPTLPPLAPPAKGSEPKASQSKPGQEGNE
jgi:general secretion pathway protein D